MDIAGRVCMFALGHGMQEYCRGKVADSVNATARYLFAIIRVCVVHDR